MMEQLIAEYQGLTRSQAEAALKKYGRNLLESSGKKTPLSILRSIVTEPMFLLLVVACALYFFLGEFSQGILMICAMALVSGISFYQEVRSENALEGLRKLAEPEAKVYRDGELLHIPSEELVPGDIMLVEEGHEVPADAEILHSNDFSVDESILTGESYAIPKNSQSDANLLFLGTSVTSGNAYTKVLATGMHTRMGKLGKSIEAIDTTPSPLQKQISTFVRYMAFAGIIAFFVVWLINYLHSHNLLEGLLYGLTLAMSVLPEEIPVAFSTFMALGAWRMVKYKVLVKNPKTVESLGAATVICLDKTGTITEEHMSVTKIYDHLSAQLQPLELGLQEPGMEVLAYAMWASETEPFDIMEKAIHEAYGSTSAADQRKNFRKIHEYPLSGRPPMMTHVYANASGERIIAAKGGVETIMEVSTLPDEEKTKILDLAHQLAKDGLRVLGVAKASFDGDAFPEEQYDFSWQFIGLITLFNPPKENLNEVLNCFYEAGIDVKIITGDYAETTKAVARAIGFRNADKYVTGDVLQHMSEPELQRTVSEHSIFARMYPEIKLRIVQALKKNAEVVAMMGDGVNDGPALKAAHIGIAMGRRGTEVAKRAASLVLLEDDFSRMPAAIALGRKIYANLKKAIQYIISIHIPIMLVVVVPLILGWKYPNIFSPIHIIFLELVMGPTCSIVYENEPMEENVMKKKPRRLQKTFFSFRELALSVTQGLVISAGLLSLYYYAIHSGYAMDETRTMVFAAIVLSNIFLTLVNRSFYFSVFRTLKYRNPLILIVIFFTLLILVAALWFHPVQALFMFHPISLHEFWLCLLVAFVSVMWIELFKWYRRKTSSLL